MSAAKTPAADACYVDSFSPVEKGLMRIGLYGLIAVGVAGMHAIDPAWGWGYLAFAALGFAGPVAGILCTRCPYPYARRTCLFLPYQVIARLYPIRPGPMKGWEKAVLVAFFTVVQVAPLPAQPPMLAAFLALALPTNAAILLRFCPRCRNRRCPFNRVRQPAA